MRPLDGFHVEVQNTGLRVRTDGGIARVSERAGLAVAESSNIVLVSAEVLLLGGSVQVTLIGMVRFFGLEEGTYLSLKEQNCWLITCHTISSDAIDRIASRMAGLC